MRGWLRAFGRNAEAVRSIFTALLVQLDPLTGLPRAVNNLAAIVDVSSACAAVTEVTAE